MQKNIKEVAIVDLITIHTMCYCILKWN